MPRRGAGGPAEAGRGWERDRPLRRAGTVRAHGGSARGSSPGAGVAAQAAGGPAAAASAPATARRRGRGGALGPPAPLRLQPRRGRRSPSRARAEPLPEPCPRRCPPPGGAAPRRERQPARSASARAAPPLQVRARSRRRKVLGELRVPTPWACAAGSCRLPVSFLRAARRRAPLLHHWPQVTCARLQSSCPHSRRGAHPWARSGPATVKSLHSINALLKFSGSAW